MSSPSLGDYKISLRNHLISAFVSDLVFPIFIIFLPLLAVELGVNGLELGLLGGIPYVTFIFMPFIVGRFADKVHSAQSLLIFAFSILTVLSFLYIVIPDPL